MGEESRVQLLNPPPSPESRKARRFDRRGGGSHRSARFPPGEGSGKDGGGGGTSLPGQLVRNARLAPRKGCWGSPLSPLRSGLAELGSERFSSAPRAAGGAPWLGSSAAIRLQAESRYACPGERIKLVSRFRFFPRTATPPPPRLQAFTFVAPLPNERVRLCRENSRTALRLGEGTGREERGGEGARTEKGGEAEVRGGVAQLGLRVPLAELLPTLSPGQRSGEEKVVKRESGRPVERRQRTISGCKLSAASSPSGK